MIEGYLVRRFENDDLARLHEIRDAAYEPVYRSFRDIVGKDIAPYAFRDAEGEQGRFLDQICAADSDHEVWVVEDDTEIAAFVSLSFNRGSKLGEIDLNAVHPDHQNSGIGASMYSFALDRMREEGMAAATVGTGGDESHAPARRAYEKAGFGPVLPTVWLYQKL